MLLVLLGLFLFTAWTAHQVETNLPPRGKFIDIDGVRLHYIDKGSGPTLLLIHRTLAGQVLNFTHSLLGRLTHDFRVVILDRHQPESVPPPFDGLAIGSPLLRRLIAWTVATPLAIANRERALTPCSARSRFRPISQPAAAGC